MKLLAKYDESWIYGMCVREKHWGEIVLLLPFHWRGQNFFLKINWYINMSIISFLSWFKIIWNYISYVILIWSTPNFTVVVHFTVTGFETEAVNHLKQTLRLNLLVLRHIHGKKRSKSSELGGLRFSVLSHFSFHFLRWSCPAVFGWGWSLWVYVNLCLLVGTSFIGLQV